MKRLGVDEEELVFLPLEHFEAQFESEGSQNARLAGIRFEHNEQCRQVSACSCCRRSCLLSRHAPRVQGSLGSELCDGDARCSWLRSSRSALASPA
eukprot:3234432-Rhodomonas_salina.4